jgi:beta-galactosidase
MASAVLRACAALFLLAVPSAVAQPAVSAPHRFLATHGRFELDGKPFQIISGDMDYVRTPRAYWRDRLRMAHAIGINTVMTYVFWNFHEAQPGQYDFTDQRDVGEFIREAQQEGLYVILRPGPYSCGEWDLGGYPEWLLRDRKLKLRSLDPAYQQATSRWMDRLGQELAPLQLDRGGPSSLCRWRTNTGRSRMLKRMTILTWSARERWYCTPDSPTRCSALRTALRR